MPLRMSVLPSEIDGVPVRALGDHAFSGRKDLEEIQIPEETEHIGKFCFYDCPSLRRISLTDAAWDIGDGSIRECPSLRWINVTVRHGSYRVIRDLLEDTMAALHFHIWLGEQTEYCLYLPAWHPEDREDTHARAIHPGFGGSGYAYRQTISRAEIRLGEYDSLFPKAMADGVRTAAETALWRLETPYKLSGQAEQIYTDYLRVHAREVLALLTEQDKEENRELLQIFLKKTRPDSSLLTEAVRRAADREQTQICSILMAYDHTQKQSADKGPETFLL